MVTKEVLEESNIIIYSYLIPLVAAFGTIGNILNLAILNNSTVIPASTMMELAAKMLLKALAVSDLMFCIAILPTASLPHNHQYDKGTFQYYYRIYGWVAINVFILMSTWIMMLLAAERYFAVYHMFRVKTYITPGRIRGAIFGVFFLSILVNIPITWRYEARPVDIRLENGTDSIEIGSIEIKYKMAEVNIVNGSVDVAYRLFWSMTGNFLPLIVMIFTSIKLIKAVKLASTADPKRHSVATQNQTNAIPQSQCINRNEPSVDDDKDKDETIKLNQLDTTPQNGAQSPSKNNEMKKDSQPSAGGAQARKITIVLMAIIVTFFILVVPSEIVKIIMRVINPETAKDPDYQFVQTVLNLAQAINFSINFILYCAVNESFRRVLWEYLLCVCCLSDNNLYFFDDDINDDPIAV